MVPLAPEDGKALEVDFTFEVIRPEQKYVQIQGTTTLPQHTHLMITISNSKLNYRASSSVNVESAGRFKSEVYKKGSNPEKNELPSGHYELEIIVPIVNVQPDSVKIVLGKGGRNLTGKYISSDTIMGNLLTYKKLFEI